jgi:UDP-glucose 4-epimerase
MTDITNKTILVTGGAGFIGSHLVDSLVADNEVRVLDNLTTGSEENINQDATFINGDVRDETELGEALQNVDIVFHQAAQVSVNKSVENPEESFSNNTDATLKLLEHARNLDFQLIIASSCAIYGEPVELPITEDHPKDPQSPYGLEKLTVDRYVRLYNELYDVETVALRYFNVYGPRQSGGEYSGVISAFLQQTMNNEPIIIHGDGSQTRDFIHVDDVVRANRLAAVTDTAGEAYNVGTGSSVSIRHLAERIRDVCDSSSDITHGDPRKGDIEQSRADIDNIRTQLGFDPEIDLTEGLESLI